MELVVALLGPEGSFSPITWASIQLLILDSFEQFENKVTASKI